MRLIDGKMSLTTMLTYPNKVGLTSVPAGASASVYVEIANTVSQYIWKCLVFRQSLGFRQQQKTNVVLFCSYMDYLHNPPASLYSCSIEWQQVLLRGER